MECSIDTFKYTNSTVHLLRIVFTFYCHSLFRANTDDNTDCAVGAHACANGCCCDSV